MVQLPHSLDCLKKNKNKNNKHKTVQVHLKQMVKEDMVSNQSTFIHRGQRNASHVKHPEAGIKSCYLGTLKTGDKRLSIWAVSMKLTESVSSTQTGPSDKQEARTVQSSCCAELVLCSQGRTGFRTGNRAAWGYLRLRQIHIILTLAQASLLIMRWGSSSLSSSSSS